MEAIAILTEIAKTNSIYGFAAKLYGDDQKLAEKFVLECHDEIKHHRQFFINNFGTKIIKEIENFAKKNGK